LVYVILGLQEFLLELGNGFSFVARQKGILLEEDDFFVVLLPPQSPAKNRLKSQKNDSIVARQY
jgi:predicted nuclease of restriction endonuclease-like (RecB) superfamily